MMKKLLIVGAGGHGRCCLDIVRNLKIYDTISFLDDNCANEIINDCKVIGGINEMDNYYPEYKDIFIAIGNNQLRKKLINKAKCLGYHVVSIIACNAVVSPYASIKDGTIIFNNAVIEANANIGAGCIIAANTTINHDAIIEDHCLINSNSVIRPNSQIGSMSRIGSNCTVTFNAKVKAGSNIEDGCVIKLKDECDFEVEI